MLLGKLRARDGLSSTTKRVIGNSFWLVGDRIARMGINVVLGAWMARYLGPGSFGTLNYVIAVVSIAGTLASLGLEKIVVRELTTRPEDAGEILGTSVFMQLIGAVGGLAATVAVVWLISHGAKEDVKIAIVFSLTMFFSAFGMIDLWFQSRIDSKYSIIARNVAFVVSSIARIVAILSRAPLVTFAAVELLNSIVTTVSQLVVYRWSSGAFRQWRVSRRRMTELLAECWPQALSSLAILIYMRIDSIMIKSIAGEAETGIYTAAIRPSEIWYFIPMSLVATVFPLIVKYKQVSETYYYARLRQLFALMAGLSITVALPMTFASGWVIHVLYGPQFSAAAPILSVHVWAGLFVFWGVAQEPWNVVEGLLKLSLFRTIIGAIINIGMNVVLIPRHGAMGAAIATVVAYGFATIVGNAFSRKTRRIFWMQLESLLFPAFFMGDIKGILRKILPGSMVKSLRRTRDKFRDGYANLSYSLEGEDMVLRRLLPNDKAGFFVDVGAHHPRRFSNTYFFYRKGWRGINIDGDRDAVDILNEERPEDINVCAAVSRDGRELKFHRYRERALNTLNSDFATERGAGDILSVETLQTQRLTDVLQKYLPANRSIDFLSIDVEGMDLEVLEGNDWDRYRPTFVLIECFGADLRAVMENPVNKYLAEKDFVAMAKTANTVIFRDLRTLPSGGTA